MRLDLSQLERALDLWASMWTAEERAHFEAALERALNESTGRQQALAALCVCYTIATPRLLGAAFAAVDAGRFDEDELAAVTAAAEPRARLLAHAARFAGDISGVSFWLEKALRDPHNPVADKLLERIDLRDLWAARQAHRDEEVRTEALRRIARRGRHQRQRLLDALDLRAEHLEGALSVDVPLDDLVAAS